jgi:hypothetical protein
VRSASRQGANPSRVWRWLATVYHAACNPDAGPPDLDSGGPVPTRLLQGAEMTGFLTQLYAGEFATEMPEPADAGRPFHRPRRPPPEVGLPKSTSMAVAGARADEGCVPSGGEARTARNGAD